MNIELKIENLINKLTFIGDVSVEKPSEIINQSINDALTKLKQSDNTLFSKDEVIDFYEFIFNRIKEVLKDQYFNSLSFPEAISKIQLPNIGRQLLEEFISTKL
jgi:hypothetical protein